MAAAMTASPTRTPTTMPAMAPPAILVLPLLPDEEPGGGGEAGIGTTAVLSRSTCVGCKCGGPAQVWSSHTCPERVNHI